MVGDAEVDRARGRPRTGQCPPGTRNSRQFNESAASRIEHEPQRVRWSRIVTAVGPYSEPVALLLRTSPQQVATGARRRYQRSTAAAQPSRSAGTSRAPSPRRRANRTSALTTGRIGSPRRAATRHPEPIEPELTAAGDVAASTTRSFLRTQCALTAERIDGELVRCALRDDDAQRPVGAELDARDADARRAMHLRFDALAVRELDRDH